MKTTIHSGRFAVSRSPLLPLSVFQAWQESDDPEAYVLKLYENPLVDEALYISSQSLHARLHEFLRGEGEAAKYPSERKKFVATLAKFLSRAAFRCTPFGLFAQVQYAPVVTTTEHSALESDPAPSSEHETTDKAERQVRRGILLDSAIEVALLEKALSEHSLREVLNWQITNTAYCVGSHLSYVDWVYQSNGQRTYRAIELDMNEGLQLLKTHCQVPQSFSEIVEMLCDDPDISAEEANEFIHMAIDRRLLLPDLAPSGSDQCTLDIALAKCPLHPALEPLRAIQADLHKLREQAHSKQSLVEGYQNLQMKIAHYLDKRDFSNGVVQIDSVVERAREIPSEQAAALTKCVQLLAQSSVTFGSSLTDFKNRFRERFEEREVNLAFALHPELGVPYPDSGNLDSELLDGLRLNQETQGGSMTVGSKVLEKVALTKLFENPKAREIAITEADLKAAGMGEIPASALAEGLYVQANVYPSSDSLGVQFEMRHIGGRNGVELLARFAHLDKQINASTREYFETDTAIDPETIYAEITHHPQDRMLNILRKPRLASYDLVYAGHSDLPRENQFWLDDLSIQLVGERLILRDRKTGRRVAPRQTSAYNYSMKQLGAYQFLAKLQEEEGSWISFSWPQSVASQAYLPRITLEGVILERARWTLEKSDIEALNQANESNQVAAWQQARNLPRFVTWDLSDNQLPVDFTNRASVSALIDEVIKHQQIHLYECLGLERALELGLTDQHSEEWIMPLRIEKQIWNVKPSAPKPDLIGEGVVCGHMDQWAYMKIYTGAGYADRVLREVVYPLFSAKPKEIDKWFFIRYKDQFEHLRLRFHSADNLYDMQQRVHTALNAARERGLVWRVQTDDYIPEVDRYGGIEGLRRAEQLFMYDSEDFLALLDIEDSAEDGHQRWVYALASLDAYVQMVLPDASDRAKFLDNIANGFLSEHTDPSTRSNAIVALGARFRDMRRSIDALRRPTASLTRWYDYLASRRDKRHLAVCTYRETISALTPGQQDSVWQGLVHMHVNRLIPADARRHEVVLYDFAKRLERARSAPKKNSKKEA